MREQERRDDRAPSRPSTPATRSHRHRASAAARAGAAGSGIGRRTTKPSSRNWTTDVSRSLPSPSAASRRSCLVHARLQLVEPPAHVVVAGALAFERLERALELDDPRLQLLRRLLRGGRLRFRARAGGSARRRRPAAGPPAWAAPAGTPAWAAPAAAPSARARRRTKASLRRRPARRQRRASTSLATLAAAVGAAPRVTCGRGRRTRWRLQPQPQPLRVAPIARAPARPAGPTPAPPTRCR